MHAPTLPISYQLNHKILISALNKRELKLETEMRKSNEALYMINGYWRRMRKYYDYKKGYLI